MLWTIKLDGGPQRVNHAAVAIGNYIYSFGGYCSNEGYDINGKIDVHVFDTVNLRWYPVYHAQDCNESDIPFKRYGHTVVAYGQKIYLWGGRNDLHSSNTLHCFDVVERRWTVPLVKGMKPKAVDGHSACIIGNYMYTFGGFQEDNDQLSQDVHRLDLYNMRWEKLVTTGTPPESRDFHSASAIGHCMFIFGGRNATFTNNVIYNNDEKYYDNIMVLDTDTMTWFNPFPMGESPSGRRSHSAVVFKDELYLFGGYNSQLNQHMDDMYKYSPRYNYWSKLEVLGRGPSARRRHCCCVVGDKLFLFGGSSPRNTTPRTIHTMNSVGFPNLIDHSDLHIMEFSISLKKLCQMKILEYNIDCSCLPQSLKQEIVAMAQENVIVTPGLSRSTYSVRSYELISDDEDVDMFVDRF